MSINKLSFQAEEYQLKVLSASKLLSVLGVKKYNKVIKEYKKYAWSAHQRKPRLLTKIEEKILKMFYDWRSYTEIGNELGVTRERIRQILNSIGLNELVRIRRERIKKHE